MPTIDVQVMEIQGSSEQISLAIDPVLRENATIAIRPHVSKFFDDMEDSAAYEALMSSDLKSGQHYRLKIMNLDSVQEVIL